MSTDCRSSLRLTCCIKPLTVSASSFNASSKDLSLMLAPFACAGVVAATVSRLWAGTRFMGVA